MAAAASPIEIYTTCPQSKDSTPADYIRRVRNVSAWSDEAGCSGMLIYTDNGIVDPWLVAQTILQGTCRLRPLVAVQPVYMHPYSAAKMVASLAFMYGRQVCLNMLAGGFKNDLFALGDETQHDERYARTIEYTLIMRHLLAGSDPIAFDGRYYRVRGLRMTPALPSDLFPRFLISGSSDAGRAAAAAIGATAIEYPKPAEELEASATMSPEPQTPALAAPPVTSRGARIGIIACASQEEAWCAAWARFPEDRRGQLAHRLAMRTSDSFWHQQLTEIATEIGKRDRSPQHTGAKAPPYWLWPFENYRSFCPYLVGDYETVAAEVARYLRLGYSTFILDVPPDPGDLNASMVVFRRAAEKAAASPIVARTSEAPTEIVPSTFPAKHGPSP